MFTVVDASNAKRSADLLDALFWERYDAFVLGRGWHDLARADGRDIDQFDDPDTVYVIGHEGDKVFAGCRIRASQKPHLLRDAFPHLVMDGAVPQGDTIYECSRLFVARRHPERIKIFLRLLLETVNWYRSKGADTLTGVIETWWLNSFLSLGFQIAPLGVPLRQGRTSIVAVRVKIDEALQANLRCRVEGMDSERSVLRPLARVVIPAYEGANDGEKAA